MLFSFKKTTVHINLLEYFFFLRSMFVFVPFFVDFAHYLTFRHCMIQIYRFSRIKSVDYRSSIISSVEGIWLDVQLTRSLFISHNFYATVRKIIYAACSIQAGRFFYWSKLTMLRSTSPAVSSLFQALGSWERKKGEREKK